MNPELLIEDKVYLYSDSSKIKILTFHFIVSQSTLDTEMLILYYFLDYHSVIWESFGLSKSEVKSKIREKTKLWSVLYG